MSLFIETKRLILREILPIDEEGKFALDSDPKVQTYLGNKPITSLEQARQTIAMIRQQYRENKIGRWAVLEKTSNNFIGWAGLKLIKTVINQQTNYYDLGYRFLRQYWHQGFATEAARTTLDYGFTTLHLSEIYAMADTCNMASRKVLEKASFKYQSTFDYGGEPHFWFCAKRPTHPADV